MIYTAHVIWSYYRRSGDKVKEANERLFGRVQSKDSEFIRRKMLWLEHSAKNIIFNMNIIAGHIIFIEPLEK